MTRTNTPTHPADIRDPHRNLRSNIATIATIKAMCGQDFGLERKLNENRRTFRFADTDVLDQVDLISITNKARAVHNREVGRLFAAPVAWLVKAVVRWNERQALRRHLQEQSDHTLKDYGIRHDQIDAVVSGSLKRGPSKLETAVDAFKYQMAA